jgi:uncharacterized repeat protein (TIGR03803 family)
MKKLTLLVTLIFCLPCFASPWKAIYDFTGGSDGYLPSGLVVGKNGYLYGATGGGGTYKAGTVFKISRSGTNTILYNFTGGSDGAGPGNSLAADSQGNFYGTTSGGAGSGCNGGGCGTIFKVTPKGKLTTLYTFQGPPTDVYSVNGPLALDAQGNIYGTGDFGANSCNFSLGCGAVFELSTSGSETILYNFTGAPDGMLPSGPIVISDAVLYGTTGGGGDVSCPYNDGYGCGVFYSVNLTNGGESVLYTFEAESGASPQGLLADGKGNFYGDTLQGGTNGEYAGTLFKLTPGQSGWSESVLYNFGGTNDGWAPSPGLVLDKAGNIYGTTAASNRSNTYGTVFKISSSGEETILHNFTSGNGRGRAPGGSNPASGVVSYDSGVLYGTAAQGGNYGGDCPQKGCGLVFRVER